MFRFFLLRLRSFPSLALFRRFLLVAAGAPPVAVGTTATNDTHPTVEKATATANEGKVGEGGWMDDYARAWAVAERQHKLLFIFFRRSPPRRPLRRVRETHPSRRGSTKEFRSRSASARRTRREIEDRGGRSTDFGPSGVRRNARAAGNRDRGFRPRRCRVLPARRKRFFPFLDGHAYSIEQVKVILDLPPGTLTQRTLIYAVRTHPEHPQSANGAFDATLRTEAESHSAYQARIGLQGHHFWESRFRRINGSLPAGCLASEVCAESWPGQGLLAAAIECVRCWRLSSGHWSAVREAQPVFGYDIQRGNNGIWYATGIFGRR